MMKQYIAIDLKSFFASVECAELGLDPLNTNLIVADESKTDKTICLAVSPSLKSLGIPGRARLFQVRQKIEQENALRLKNAPGHKFTGKSHFKNRLDHDKNLEIDMIVAPPRMRRYMEYSASIVQIYLKYVSAEDILIYSIDEVFIDATRYLKMYNRSAKEFASMLINDVLKETHITATVGIGTNMYLAKVAMDIVAKRMPADKNGVRIAYLDEKTYRETLWCHRPLTDFWRIGNGTSSKLEKVGIYTMGDIARCSLGKPNEYYNEDLLYKLFGVNAELIIDHAWGYEPSEISDCKSYKPESKSLSHGQVLSRPYTYDEGRTIVCEMADHLSNDLVSQELFCDQVVLDIGYDIENITNPSLSSKYSGAINLDQYSRRVPKPSHGSKNLHFHTSLSSKIIEAVCDIYDRIADRDLLIRRFNLSVNHLLYKEQIDNLPVQLDLFDAISSQTNNQDEQKSAEKELKVQQTLVNIRDRFGKNSVIKGLNIKKGATGIERNRQIGGHKA